MKRPTGKGFWGRNNWKGLWGVFGGTPRLRPPERRGRLQFESLEMRRVMYGADFVELGEGEFGEGEPGSRVAEFSLTDVNPNSSTVNQTVSPSDFSQQASAWYFGHST